MRDAKIVTVYKSKGDCNNYKGIFLLSVAIKNFARIFLKHLQKLADLIQAETLWI